MLSWVVTFFILAIVAAVLGFGGLAGTFAGVAKILALVLVVFAVLGFAFGRSYTPPTTPDPWV